MNLICHLIYFSHLFTIPPLHCLLYLFLCVCFRLRAHVNVTNNKTLSCVLWLMFLWFECIEIEIGKKSHFEKWNRREIPISNGVTCFRSWGNVHLTASNWMMILNVTELRAWNAERNYVLYSPVFNEWITQLFSIFFRFCFLCMIKIIAVDRFFHKLRSLCIENEKTSWPMTLCR